MRTKFVRSLGLSGGTLLLQEAVQSRNTGKTLCAAVVLTLLFASSAAASTNTLEGHVVGQEGEPLGGAAVEIQELELTVLTNESGYFKFENLPPRSVTVEATME